jgi:hypothetical protein
MIFISVFVPLNSFDDTGQGPEEFAAPAGLFLSIPACQHSMPAVRN